MPEEFNPYAAPQANPLLENADASSIRMSCLRAESNVKACGVVSITIGIIILLAVFSFSKNRQKEIGDLYYLGWTWVFPFLPFIAGIGLCLLRRWGWAMAVAFYGFLIVWDLFRLPRSIIPLLIEIIILRCLLVSNTRKVMSKNYAAVKKATPELTSHVAFWGWLVGGLMILTWSILMS